MQKRLLAATGAAAALALSNGAGAQNIQTNVGPFELRAQIGLSVQGALFEDPRTGLSDEDGDADASLVAIAEYITDNGMIFGFRGEIDTADRGAEDLSRDEIYGYVVGSFGRIELGEQDGAADVMSFHAPQIGLGQVRGDFTRYTGQAALLSPFDTRDEFKFVYLSPPIRGLRFGASYAPTVDSNEDAADPRARTIQDDAFEFGVQYQWPLGDWAAGVSAAYVTADADPITQREDIESWSVGGQLRRDPWRIGAAYVSRGDSNRLTPGFDQDEINFGVTYETDRWALAGSAAFTDASDRSNTLFGVGGVYNVNDFVFIRADAVYIDEERDGRNFGDGYALVTEIGFVY